MSATVGCPVWTVPTKIQDPTKAIHWTDLTPDEADQLLAGTALGMGNVKPKIEAGVHFVGGGVERAIIADLAHGLEAIRSETGTTITGEN